MLRSRSKCFFFAVILPFLTVMSPHLANSSEPLKSKPASFVSKGSDADRDAEAKVKAGGETIAKVWAGNPVRFGIVASSRSIYIGYYDVQRRLTVAQRALSGGPWSYTRLDAFTNWDSHRTINMAVDNSGRLHIAANMHASPLVYYMSDPTGAADSLKPVSVLADMQEEKSITYPSFLRDPSNRLILKFRSGTVGNGNEIYDIFDDVKGTWSHLTPTAIVDGQGKRSAYFVGPRLGPDGWYHMAWVWCESILYEANHDLSYAKSRDLIHWEKADGTKLTLPITLSTSDIIAPVKEKSALLNGPVGFDSENRVMIGFHTYDSKGQSQVYLARREGNRWHVVQASQWHDYRWSIVSGGSIPFEVNIGSPGQVGNDVIVPLTRQGQRIVLHLKAGDLSPDGQVEENGSTDEMASLGNLPVPTGMLLNKVGTVENGQPYVIAWASEPPNRDKPRKGALPDSHLVLFSAPREVRTVHPKSD
jgi:hypothetical protein